MIRNYVRRIDGSLPRDPLLLRPTSLVLCFIAVLASVFLVPAGAFTNLGLIAIAAPALTEILLRSGSLHPSYSICKRGFFLFLAAALGVGIVLIIGGASWAATQKAMINFAMLGLLLVFAYLVAVRIDEQIVLLLVILFAAASAALSIVIFLGSTQERLIPLGRAGNPIPGAGGLVAGIAAGFALIQTNRETRSRLIGIILAMILTSVAVLFTGSRGPLLSLGAAVVLSYLINGNRSAIMMASACFFIYGLLTLGLAFESRIFSFVCQLSEFFCRPSHRAVVWEWAAERIASNPLFGTGPQFRFNELGTNHPHNGLIGMTMYYGIPFSIAAAGILFVAIDRVAKYSSRSALTWCSFSLIFSFGYMASDLSDPFAHFNTHYMFFWFPLFYALASVELDQNDEVSTDG